MTAEQAPSEGELVVRDVSQIADARNAVGDASEPHVGPTRAHDVRLALSELVTNALEHGNGGDVLVEYGVNDDAFVVTVTADSGALPVAGPAPATDQVTGRGLRIVASVTDAVLISGTGTAMSVSCSFRVH